MGTAAGKHQHQGARYVQSLALELATAARGQRMANTPLAAYNSLRQACCGASPCAGEEQECAASTAAHDIFED